MIPLCQDQGIGLITWSPLAKGFLTGKYVRGEAHDSVRYRSDSNLAKRFFKPEDFDVVEEVLEVAKEKGVKPAQVALAWHFYKGITAPIIGTTKVQHVEEAVEALNVHLSPDDIHRLEAPYKTKPIIGHV
jgi:aryl-alcohol dehydrogenase (NADP+)